MPIKEELTAEQVQQIKIYKDFNAEDVEAVRNFIRNNDVEGFNNYKATAIDLNGNPRSLHLEGMEIQGSNYGTNAKDQTRKVGDPLSLDGEWDFAGKKSGMACVMTACQFHDVNFTGGAHLPASFRTAEVGVGETEDFKRYPATLDSVSINGGSLANLEDVVIKGSGLTIRGTEQKPFDMRGANLQNLHTNFHEGAKIEVIGAIDMKGAYMGGEAKSHGEEVMAYDASLPKNDDRNFKITKADRTEFSKLVNKAPELLKEYGKDNGLDVEPLFVAYKKPENPGKDASPAEKAEYEAERRELLKANQQVREAGVTEQYLASIAKRTGDDHNELAFAGQFLGVSGTHAEAKKDLDHGTAAPGLTLGQQIAFSVHAGDHAASETACKSGDSASVGGKGASGKKGNSFGL